MNRKRCYGTRHLLLFCLMISLAVSGCGKKQASDLKKAEKESNATVYTSDFVMDKEVRSGFMDEGEPYSSAPDGYTEIHSVEEMSEAIEAKKGKYILMEDLDFTKKTWISKDFNGVLEGNYHVISGLGNPLFKKLTGTVQNLGLENVDTNGASVALNMNGGELNNCYVDGKVTGDGGLVGAIDLQYRNENKNSVKISSCYNAAEVIAADRTGAIGGIAGYIDLSVLSSAFQVTVRNCENYGTIEGSESTGGIIGNICRGVSATGYYSVADLSCSVSDCFNYGEVKGKRYVGGVIGVVSVTNASETLKNIYEITSCANYANVLVEENTTSTDPMSGGICGKIRTEANGNNTLVQVMISDCLNTADIKDPKGLGGGICGLVEMEKGTCKISRCIGIGDSAGAVDFRESIHNSHPLYECTDYYSPVRMSIAEMKNITENLQMFDYPSTWGIDEYFCGFPHPYGDDESEAVMKYANAQQKQKAEEVTENSSGSDIILNQHYVDALERMCLGGYWPDDTENENYAEYLLMWNDNPQTYFDIADFDQDGTKELIVKAEEYYYAVYSYDFDKKMFVKKYSCEGSEQWQEKYGDGSDIEWKLAKTDNFTFYTDAYMNYYKELLEKDLPEDMAILYMNKNSDADEMINDISSAYGVSFEEGEEEYIAEGKYNGKTIVRINKEDGMTLYYTKKWKDVTLCGIYPGMKEEDAKKVIAKYGFYWGQYNYKMGNYLLNFTVEDGVVVSIDIYCGSEYAG